MKSKRINSPPSGEGRPPSSFHKADAFIWVGTRAALLAAAALFAGCEANAGSPSPDPAPPATAANVTLTTAQRSHIRLQTVQPVKFHKSIEATGTVDFDMDQATTVLAPIGGPAARLIVSLGQRVKAGEPLAEVNSPDFATAIGAYRKAIASAKTAREVADYDRQLLDHHAIPQRDADQADLDARNAAEDSDVALQALVSLKVDPQVIKVLQQGGPPVSVQGTIRSPLSGTVVEKLITPGELLQAGSTPCFTVADLSRVWVMAHLFGSDLAAAGIGDSANIDTGFTTQTLSGMVDNISAMVDPDTRSVVVRVVVNNPGDVLKKGMYVRVRIQSRREDSGLLVPVSAILRDDENLPFVYVAESSGGFARRPVTLSYRIGDQYEISSGLETGDQVVIDGAIFVQFIQNQ